LVHGLWDDQTAWDNFTGLTNDPLSRFFIGRADYSYNVGNSLGAFTPTYESFAYPFLNSARANSLGFSYNALGVLSQIQTFVGEFKSGKNPLGISVASVQADIVAHSMGGDIARDLPLAPSFLSFDTFAQGNIHKLITIGTPHLGSPLANQLLSDSNICVRSVLALKGKVTFDKVSVFGQVTSGGVSDLQGDGFGTFPALSPPLQALQQSTAHPLPTAMISGIADSSNFNALNSSVFASLLTQFCPEPLAQALTPAGWPLIFGQSSDAIVPLRSQLNLTAGTPITATPISSVVHSKGTESLGFGPPDELDDVTGIPTAVIGLLNTPVTSSTFTPLP